MDLPRLEVVQEAAQLLADTRAAVEVAGPWGSSKTLIAAQTAHALAAPLFLLTSGRIEADAVFDDLTTFADPAQCMMFPAWEVLPSDAMDPSDDIVAERMNTLKQLVAAPEDRPAYVVAPVCSLLQYVIPRDHLARQALVLQIGKEYDLDDLIDALIELGYERELMVERRGHMSIRGCIFDIFPISSELPYRIEFFGDEIESIRRFEPETQRSVEQVDTLRILPRSEKQLILSLAGARSMISDYLPDNALVAIDEPMAVEEEARTIEARTGDTPFFMPWEEARHALKRFRRISLAQVAGGRQEEVPRLTVQSRSMSHWEPPAEDFWGQLQQWDQSRYTVVLYCNNTV